MPRQQDDDKPSPPLWRALDDLMHQRRSNPTRLARESGVSHATIYGIRSGRTPYPDTLARLARALTPAPTAPPTATPRPDPAQAEYLDPRELAAEPKAHVGKNIILQGKALNVEHKDASRGILGNTEPHTWINLQASVRGRQGTTETIVIELYPKETKVLKDDCYQIRGLVAGTQKVRRLLTGAENEVPVIRGYDWQAVPAGQYGLCPTL